MNDSVSRRTSRSRFSLSTLLVLTALVALGIALGLAQRLNRALVQQRDALLALSSRLPIDHENELFFIAIPDVADDFHSWHVQVPPGEAYELRLGMGEVSVKGIPPIAGRVPIPEGRHRVTLLTGDSVSEEFRYTVYLDGVPAIEHTMGSQWIPGGWSSAGSMAWPSTTANSPAIQLAAQNYSPTHKFGTNDYFNGQYDTSVTRQGYRLWIDQADRTYERASPFMEHPGLQFDGIGLRDGLRFAPSVPATYQWTFTRPMLATMQPMLRIDAEFTAHDGTILNSQSQALKHWQIRPGAVALDTPGLPEEPSTTVQTAFLHGVSISGEGLQPVIEMKWDVAQPDAVGIRLADTPANDPIARWRLRISSGSQHLWREFKTGDRPWMTSAEALNMTSVDGDSRSVISRKAIDLVLDAATSNIDLQWQTNETLPLQIVQRSHSDYATLQLYQGLPVRMGLRLATALKPKLTVEVVDQQLNSPPSVIPGGPVFEAIHIELEGIPREWMWLSASAKE